MCELNGAGSQRITRVVQAVLATLIETLDLALPARAGWVEGRLNKGTVVPASTSIRDRNESCPSSPHTEANSVPPLMS